MQNPIFIGRSLAEGDVAWPVARRMRCCMAGRPQKASDGVQKPIFEIGLGSALLRAVLRRLQNGIAKAGKKHECHCELAEFSQPAGRGGGWFAAAAGSRGARAPGRPVGGGCGAVPCRAAGRSAKAAGEGRRVPVKNTSGTAHSRHFPGGRPAAAGAAAAATGFREGQARLAH